MRRLFLLSVVLPALALALLGLVLLGAFAKQMETSVEKERIRSAEGVAQAQTFVWRGLLDLRLDRIAAQTDEAALVDHLRALVDADPLVRNAFLWRKGEGCVWPRSAGCNETERDFLQRYRPLFSGAVPWTPPDSPSRNEGEGSGDIQTRGYRPWASGDRADLLAWVRNPDGSIAGFEVESVRILADAEQGHREADEANAARRTSRKGFASEIRDASGRVLVPAVRPVSGNVPFGESSLAPLFPQWRLRVYGTDESAAGYARLFVALAAVLLGLLLCSLVAGGALLLRAARKERLDALRKTEFVSNVSHELRTPLTSIRMFADLLSSGRLSNDEDRRKALETISSESARLSRLVEGVLDFSRLERNRRRYAIEQIDLIEFVQNMVGVRPDGPAVAALADRDAVKQILTNLLDNAAKYAPGAPPEIIVRESGNGLVLLDVLDRGPGVPPHARKRIFERFYRADNSATREIGGNGLGLSIARGLARGMGGDLVYTPRPGGGSIFTLSLPPA